MLIVDIQVCPKRYYLLCFSLIWNSSPDLAVVSHLLRFGTSSTRAGGQDDVSSNKLPQISISIIIIIMIIIILTITTSMT